jgi:hypothetical protein
LGELALSDKFLSKGKKGSSRMDVTEFGCPHLRRSW